MRHGVADQHQFVTLNGCAIPVFSRWTYTAREPYLVKLAFRTEHARWIDWVFARDLLVEGLERPTGLGDVRVRPDLAIEHELMVIELESPDGFAIVEMRREDMARFVETTCQMVPLGAEGDLLDIDGFIAQVIGV